MLWHDLTLHINDVLHHSKPSRSLCTSPSRLSQAAKDHIVLQPGAHAIGTNTFAQHRYLVHLKIEFEGARQHPSRLHIWIHN